MKKLFGLLSVFLAFLLVAFIALAMFPPTELTLRMLAANLRKQTGVDLKISGPKKLRLHPEFAWRSPDVSFSAENVTLSSNAASGGKPIATARSLQVTTSLLGAIRGHRIDRVTLTNPTVDVEIGKDGFPLGVDMPQKRTATAAPTGAPYSLAVLELTDANISYRDQRDGSTVRLEGATATLSDVWLDRFAEALVKAGAVTVESPADIGRIEISGLDAKLSTFEQGRVREVQGGGGKLKWQRPSASGTLEADKFAAGGRSVGANGADGVTFTADQSLWREANGRMLRASAVSANLAAVRAEGAGAADVKAGLISWREVSGETYEAANLAAKAGSIRLEGIGSLDMKAGAASWRDASGRTLEAVDLSGTAKLVRPSRIDDLSVTGSRATWKDAKRSNSATGLTVEQPTFSTVVLASGVPIDGTASFVWNKERVNAKVKLPAPEALATAAALPANVSLATARGTLDFDGAIETSSGIARGRTKAVSTSVEALAGWLGVNLPATVKGPVDISGNIDAGPNRVALAGGRITHGANLVNGDIAVDLTNARPRLSGRLVADKLDADNYLGFEQVKPTSKPTQGAPRPLSVPRPVEVEPEVQLSDIFKSHVRAYVDGGGEVTRGGSGLPSLSSEELLSSTRSRAPAKPAFSWSTANFDVSALRAVDLDIDWAVKQLNVRGMELTVPQLKTVIDGGEMTLQGRDVGMQEGRLSGEARIDARQAVPAISANVKGQGVDVLAITEALGMPPMIDGITSIDANVRSSGTNQRQLVEGLSGTVKTDMPQGHVLGYDIGSMNLFSMLRIFSNRQFDPDRRTPISSLKADLDIEKGNVRDSQLTMGGPFLGVKAEGTMKLVEQQIDYRGSARIASIFSGLRFKLFGDLTRPSFQPDLGIFSRGGPGDPSITDIVNAAELKPDPELALLVGRALLKATANGDANMLSMLQALQKKALGN